MCAKGGRAVITAMQIVICEFIRPTQNVEARKMFTVTILPQTLQVLGYVRRAARKSFGTTASKTVIKVTL